MDPSVKNVHVTPLGDEFLLNDTLCEGSFLSLSFLRAHQGARDTSIVAFQELIQTFSLE